MRDRQRIIPRRQRDPTQSRARCNGCAFALHCLLEVAFCPFKLVGGQRNIAQPEQAIAVAWRQFQCGLEVLLRFLQLSLTPQQDPQQVVRLSLFRVDHQHVAQCGSRRAVKLVRHVVPTKLQPGASRFGASKRGHREDAIQALTHRPQYLGISSLTACQRDLRQGFKGITPALVAAAHRSQQERAAEYRQPQTSDWPAPLHSASPVPRRSR